MSGEFRASNAPTGPTRDCSGSMSVVQIWLTLGAVIRMALCRRSTHSFLRTRLAIAATLARLLHLCDGRKRRLTPTIEGLLTYGLQAITTQRTMKMRIVSSSLILALAACGTIFFAGCASMETDNTKSLLSEAGFRTRTPQTAKQKELYAELQVTKSSAPQ